MVCVVYVSVFRCFCFFYSLPVPLDPTLCEFLQKRFFLYVDLQPKNHSIADSLVFGFLIIFSNVISYVQQEPFLIYHLLLQGCVQCGLPLSFNKYVPKISRRYPFYNRCPIEKFGKYYQQYSSNFITIRNFVTHLQQFGLFWIYKQAIYFPRVNDPK